MNRKRIIPEEAIQIVKAHYKFLPNKVIREKLIAAFPHINFGLGVVASILFANNLKRTPEERKVLTEYLVKTGVKLKAVNKMHKTKGSCQVGGIKLSKYSTLKEKRWVIMTGPHNYKLYSTYLWTQHYGKPPDGYRADWIDANKPLTIDNLELIKYKNDRIAIGGITVWKCLDRYRELIKTAPGKYELLLPYLWRQHIGEIPPGKYVAKIDHTKPSTIDNLHLVSDQTIANGSKALEDWFIKANLISMGFSPDNIPDSLIDLQRSKIQLKREIKAKKNAGESNESTNQ